MGSFTEYFDVFNKFSNRESSILLKLKALEKVYGTRSSNSTSEQRITTYDEVENDLIRKRIETLGRKDANSRNMSFLKELNIAETQLRLMACFCPTDIYLQACKAKLLKLKPAPNPEINSKEKPKKKRVQVSGK
ncbi:uncharacterized protein LOC124158734 [Ischnura elegans]|uniref:uncharacterized protein LOC124158734 n=1 Tax=Ischnura elegans TaxID=197161 RepID=UPI001ED8B6AE|nr:uncharacterized protein LOC124158734 [Ischnura elegans]